MGAASLTCDRCRTRLPATALNTQDLVACPACSTPLRFLVFPAYYRAHAPAQKGETLMVEGESSCFYHPTKKAVVPCDGCGRFLCALCDVELDNKHLCPKCLEAAKEKRTMDSLEHERYLYDAQALTLTVAGAVVLPCMPYVTVFLAAAALYLCIRYRHKPRSIVSPGRARTVVALVLGIVELPVAVAYLGLMFYGVFY
ncbi:MAG: hypothetical protein HUU46_02980 [Candidatus Hydrogenedentes bacterium]|nr:hypothetical protein [Candidatus Hydrogenedentota bacterium]